MPIYIDPEMARDIGYTDEVVEADKFAARVREKADYFKTLDAKAYAGNKRLIRKALADKMTADLSAQTPVSASPPELLGYR